MKKYFEEQILKSCSCKEILDNYHKESGYRNVVKEIMESTKEN